MDALTQLMRSFPFDAYSYEYRQTVNREFYQSGRMDMLFNLVDAGVVELDVAADFAGMSVEDADDMLQGWIMAQQIKDLFEEE